MPCDFHIAWCLTRVLPFTCVVTKGAPQVITTRYHTQDALALQTTVLRTYMYTQSGNKNKEFIVSIGNNYEKYNIILVHNPNESEPYKI